MAKYKIDEYDCKALREARQRIMIVYNYHYGSPSSSSVINRLESIIKRIDWLIESGEGGAENA